MKQLKIEVAPGDLKNLHKSGYRMCFAKQVNDRFNVVWEAQKAYLTKTNFRWEPEYKVFGTDTFDSGVKVEIATGMVDMILGQTVTMNKSGILGAPVPGGDPLSLNFNNTFGDIHPGVADKYGKPIYITERNVVKGLTKLTPRDIVSVWFQQYVETSTMIDESRSLEITVDLTTADSRSIKFENRMWTVTG